MKNQQLLLQAYLLALSKQYEEALDLLNSDPLFQSDETAMELRARIFLEQGEKTSAKREWMNLLRVAPENETAREVVRNISGFRGWFFCDGKYFAAGILFVAFMFGVFYAGQTIRKSSEIKTPPPVQSVYAEFVIPTVLNTTTTASIQAFLTSNKFEGKTLLIFSEHPMTGIIFSDMAIEFGLQPSNIICLPMKSNSSSVAVLRIIEGQNKALRYEN